MKARSNRFSSVTAFSGLEYVRHEWRDVPKGFEAEARGNPFLELQEDIVEAEPVVFSPSEPIAVEPPGKRKRRGQK